jgi:molecular chaperone GrpE (heat shock protein)
MMARAGERAHWRSVALADQFKANGPDAEQLLEGVNLALRGTAGADSMTRQQQRIEELERENERLKNELLAANEQTAQLKILRERDTMQIRQLKERKILNRC